MPVVLRLCEKKANYKMKDMKGFRIDNLKGESDDQAGRGMHVSFHSASRVS